MTNTSKGLLITSLGAFIISFEALFIKFTTVEPFLFSFYIGICMFLSTGLLVIAKKRDVLKSNLYKKSFKFALIGAFFMAISNLFFISAIKATLTANVVLILASTPIFASFYAYIIYKVKPQKNIYFASAFIFLGLYVIFSDQLGFGNIEGNIYALICANLFSLSFVFLSHHTNIDRVILICLSGLFLTILTFFFNESLVIDMKNLLYILAMGIFITPISRVLLSSGTKYISASEVSLLMIIETVMAPIWVWLFLNEIPSSYTFIGGGIILITLIVNSIYTMKRKH